MNYLLNKVEASPDKQAIERDLLNRVPYKVLSEKYNISAQALSTHYKNKMLPQLAKILKEDRKQDAEYLLKKIERLSDRCEKVVGACDKWLSDPDNKDEYNLDPRAEELLVIYTVTNARGNKIRHKENLQELLDKARLDKGDVTKVIATSADPRELILKAVKETRETVKLIAEITGQLSSITSVIDVKVLMPNLMSIITNAVGDNVGIQSQISKNLIKVLQDAETESNLP